MAKIQRLTEQSVKLRPVTGTKDSTRVTVGPANTGIGEGLQNFGNSMLALQDKVDTTRVTEAETNFFKQADDLLYNADDAYYKSKGRAAFDGAEEINKRLEKLRREVAEGLQSDKQRRMFDLIAQKRMMLDNKNISKYAQNELNVYDQATSAARIDNANESVRNDYSTESIETNWVRVRDEVNDQAEKNGLSPEARMNELDKARSTLVTGAVMQAIQDEDTVTANSLLDRYAGDLREEDENALKDKLKLVDDAQKAQDIADQIRLQGGTREERLNRVYEIDDPDIRKAVRTQVLDAFNQEKLQIAENEKTSYDEALKLVEAGVPMSYMKGQAVWDSMSQAQRDDIEARITKKYTRKDVVTPIGVYDKMREYLGQGNTTKAREYFLKNYHLMSNEDQRKFSQETQEGTKVDEDFYAARDYVKTQLKEIVDDEKLHGEFQYQFEQWYDRYKSEHKGDAPTLAEIKNQVDFMLEKVDPGTLWFGAAPNKHRFAIDADAQAQAVEDGIAAFEDVLNRSPSEAEVKTLNEEIKRYYEAMREYPSKKYIKERLKASNK